MLYGVDVHDGYQRGLSFPTLARQGYTFAAVKLTQGTGYVRDLADEWITAARTAGLIPGAYHWLTAADGAAQARWFHKHVQAAGGPEGMLIQLDAEDDGYGPQMTAWAREWERLTGGHPFLIYSGAWWWPRTGGFNGAALTPYLWHSHYLTADADTLPDDPAAFAARIPASWWTPGYGGWPNATFIQFTSRGDAGGLANNVDLNCTRLTREQLLALTATGDDPMRTVILAKDHTGQIWAGNGVQRRPVAPASLPGLLWTLSMSGRFGQPQITAASIETYDDISVLGEPVLTASAVVDALVARLPAGTFALADVEAVVRDAVADLGEGGAAAVRADA